MDNITEIMAVCEIDGDLTVEVLDLEFVLSETEEAMLELLAITAKLAREGGHHAR